MFKFKQSLVAFAGVFALVSAVALLTPRAGLGQKPSPIPPGHNVTVVNTPLPVMDVDNPARQPFQATVPFTVPAGKRLVIEYLSAAARTSSTCRLLSVTLYTRVNGQEEPLIHTFTPVLTGGDTANNFYTVSQQTRIYADPLSLVFDGFSSLPCEPSITRPVVSGYLVDVPATPAP